MLSHSNMAYSSFTEQQFRRRVDKALAAVRTILDVDRTPRYAEDQDHKYDDKYALTDLMTNTAIAAQINVLERMGLDQATLRRLTQVVQDEKRSVTLRFAAQDSCTFVKKQEVTLMSPHEVHVETTEETPGSLLRSSKKQKTTHKVSTTVSEYHWNVTVSYKLLVFVGNDPDKDSIELQTRSCSTTIITRGSKETPLPQSTVHPFEDVSLTWLLQQVSTDKQVCSFQIDRSDHEKCRTPRRNAQVDEAFEFFRDWERWAAACSRYFWHRVQRKILGQHNPADSPSAQPRDIRSINATDIFCPILPLLKDPNEVSSSSSQNEERTTRPLVALPTTDGTNETPLLSVSDIDKFLQEQIRQLDEARQSLALSFPLASDQDKLISVQETDLVLLWSHATLLGVAFQNGVDYVEEMLRKQLIAAIGKEVYQSDFDQFVKFHSKKFLGPLYTPKPFCHAIRRPNHYPDGVLSIEGLTDGPIETMVKCVDSGPSMFVPINAATSVEIAGPRYLHGWIRHKFHAKVAPQNYGFNLTARARQFSSFLLVVGTISGPTQFTPKDAIILQNKDEVMIPLLLNELPTAKQFKDAITSLSPEQQRFAKSFRAMQLESSVFGVCVVQLKPQLEVLLGLPPDALTKEIRLTQDLLSLFIDYQIPSDLLSYDGPPDVAVATKVAAVREHVNSVMAVIEGAKETQLRNAEQVAEMNINRAFGGQPPPEPLAADRFYSGLQPQQACMMSLAHIDNSDAAMAVQEERLPRSELFSPPTYSQKWKRSQPSTDDTRQWQPPDDVQLQPPDAAEDSSAMLAATVPTKQHDVPSDGKPHALPSRENGRDSSGNQPPVSTEASDTSPTDFTMIPKQLDAKFDVHDTDSALRATIIETQDQWMRTRHKNLLTRAQTSNLTSETIKTEKQKAFDLLDALSRSGSLPIACAELHVVVAVTHCFEKDLMGTVIQDNVNPIEKVEKTMLLMGSTIHNVDPVALIENQAHAARLLQSFPSLFAPSDDRALTEE